VGELGLCLLGVILLASLYGRLAVGSILTLGRALMSSPKKVRLPRAATLPSARELAANAWATTRIIFRTHSPKRLVLYVYPPWWRSQRGDEYLELLCQVPLTLAWFWDISRLALDAWIHPDSMRLPSRSGRHVVQQVLQCAVSVVAIGVFLLVFPVTLIIALVVSTRERAAEGSRRRQVTMGRILEYRPTSRWVYDTFAGGAAPPDAQPFYGGELGRIVQPAFRPTLIELTPVDALLLKQSSRSTYDLSAWVLDAAWYRPPTADEAVRAILATQLGQGVTPLPSRDGDSCTRALPPKSSSTDSGSTSALA
jgi:hypothetical protein